MGINHELWYHSCMPRPTSPFMAVRETTAGEAVKMQTHRDELQFLAIILRLYIDDPEARVAVFKSESRHPRKTITALASAPDPRITAMQSNLSTLAPTATTLKLYFKSGPEAKEPDRCVTLRRTPSSSSEKPGKPGSTQNKAGEPALWWPASPYISREFKGVHTDGVLVSWPAHTHYMEMASATLALVRCGRGSTQGLARLDADIQRDYELRRQLTYAIIRQRIGHPTRSKLYLNPKAPAATTTLGKITYEHEQLTHANLMVPLDFKLSGLRRQARPSIVAPSHIFAYVDDEDVSEYAGEQPLYIASDTSSAVNTDFGPQLSILLRELLHSNLVPWIVVDQSEETGLSAFYSLVMPNFDPASGEVTLASTQNYLRMPATYAVSRSSKGWLPDHSLAEALRGYLTHEPHRDEYLAPHRKALAQRVLQTSLTPRRRGDVLSLEDCLDFHGLEPIGSDTH